MRLSPPALTLAARKLPALGHPSRTPRSIFVGIVALGLPFAVTIGWSVGGAPAATTSPSVSAPGVATGMGPAPSRKPSPVVTVEAWSNRQTGTVDDPVSRRRTGATTGPRASASASGHPGSPSSRPPTPTTPASEPPAPTDPPASTPPPTGRVEVAPRF